MLETVGNELGDLPLITVSINPQHRTLYVSLFNVRNCRNNRLIITVGLRGGGKRSRESDQKPLQFMRPRVRPELVGENAHHDGIPPRSGPDSAAMWQNLRLPAGGRGGRGNFQFTDICQVCICRFNIRIESISCTFMRAKEFLYFALSVVVRSHMNIMSRVIYCNNIKG